MPNHLGGGSRPYVGLAAGERAHSRTKVRAGQTAEHPACGTRTAEHVWMDASKDGAMKKTKKEAGVFLNWGVQRRVLKTCVRMEPLEFVQLPELSELTERELEEFKLQHGTRCETPRHAIRYGQLCMALENYLKSCGASGSVEAISKLDSELESKSMLKFIMCDIAPSNGAVASGKGESASSGRANSSSSGRFTFNIDTSGDSLSELDKSKQLALREDAEKCFDDKKAMADIETLQRVVREDDTATPEDVVAVDAELATFVGPLASSADQGAVRVALKRLRTFIRSLSRERPGETPEKKLTLLERHWSEYVWSCIERAQDPTAIAP